MKGSNLATEKIPAYAGNYTKGRSGYSITEITIHHMAAKWTARRCGESYQAPRRKASGHYGIGFEGEMAQYVSEDDTAWTNDLWESNCRAVTIECANSETGGDWQISEKTMDSLVLLIADIAVRNGLYPLVKGENLTWHQMYSPTACPGSFLISKMDEITERVNRHIETSLGMKKETVDCSYQVFTDRWLPVVSGHDQTDAEYGYAGILGAPVSGVLASASCGNLYYKAHLIGGSWLPEVKNREDYAGVLGRSIDGFMIRSDTTRIFYRVHTRQDGWLPVVEGYDPANHEHGYAGVLGHEIDGVMIWAKPVFH
ncbi:MAG: N-acetylmuramoyl-L-alanine amidase [Clostridia bacterium]|nr:N-acetylmuramoyl-L-alanine amidase [Clostridia bacterium]